MAEKIKVQQYDNGIKLVFSIKKDNMIESIQGSEILFKFKHQVNGTSYTRYCNITDAQAGECEYVLTTEDLTIQGTYITELETRYPNGTILSVDNPLILIVTPEQIEVKRHNIFNKY